jgi:hypothetical protein
MTFQVEITPIAETQIEQAYRWYRFEGVQLLFCMYATVLKHCSPWTIFPFNP